MYACVQLELTSLRYVVVVTLSMGSLLCDRRWRTPVSNKSGESLPSIRLSTPFKSPSEGRVTDAVRSRTRDSRETWILGIAYSSDS